ncbi:MAG: hypothetical protein Q4C56_04040 [Peptococcaceae bacterium]|nr:hypothetical protein [Peptococcaceae bacterium]
MSFRGHLRPGQGFQPLRVLRREVAISQTGRPQTENLAEVGRILGIISQCSPKEAEQFKQAGHPVTHTIVQRGSAESARPTDILEARPKLGGKRRQFLVQTVHDPAELGHFTIYKVLEREDLT